MSVDPTHEALGALFTKLAQEHPVGLAPIEFPKALLEEMSGHETLFIAHAFGDFWPEILAQAEDDVLNRRESRAGAFDDPERRAFYEAAFRYATVELLHARAFIDSMSAQEAAALHRSGREWTRYERAVLHGDTSDDFKNRHIAANTDLIARFDAGERLTKADAKRARQIKKWRAAGETWC